MEHKKIIAYINAENEIASNVLKSAEKYARDGADGLFLYNYAKDAASKAEFLRLLEKIKASIDISFVAGYYTKQPEDIKRLFDAGAARIVINEKFLNEKEMNETLKQYESERLIVEIDSQGEFADYERSLYLKKLGFGAILLKHVDASPRLNNNIGKSHLPVIIRDSLVRHMISDIINIDNVVGVATNYYRHRDLKKAKFGLKENGMIKSLQGT